MNCDVQSDLEQLKQLWQVAFGDSRDYVDFYFERAYSTDKTVTRRADGKIVSAAQYRHFDLISGVHTLKVTYILGVCTHPAHRRRGLAASIVQQIISEQGTMGVDVVFLIPSNAALFEYYAQLGLENVFTAYEEKVTENDVFGDKYELFQPKIHDLFDFYTKFYQKLGVAALKDFDFFEIIFRGVADFGGNISICGENGVIRGFAAVEDGVVKELLCLDAKARNTLLTQALIQSGGREIRAIYPINSPADVIGRNAAQINIGMAKAISPRCDLNALSGAYANLLLN